MITNNELAKLWSNNEKRRAFIQNFKAWGVWFTQPELDLTFYKYDLPGGSRIIAMEYLRDFYPYERPEDGRKYAVNHLLYLQHGKYFSPTTVSEHVLAGRLMDLKEKLMKGAA